MIDYSRKVHKRNYEVWEYTGPPPKVERYRYGGELKARIRYHPAKLKRVTYQYEPQRSFDAPRAEPCSENLERNRDERAGSSVA